MTVCKAYTIAIIPPYLITKSRVKTSFLNEVPHHFGVAFTHCIVETALTCLVQVKPAVSKFGHEVLDNLQVAANGSKVESIQKVLSKYKILHDLSVKGC